MRRGNIKKSDEIQNEQSSTWYKSVRIVALSIIRYGLCECVFVCLCACACVRTVRRGEATLNVVLCMNVSEQSNERVSSFSIPQNALVCL